MVTGGQYAVSVAANLEYASVAGRSLRLDLYRPDVEAPPVAVYLHGGAFKVGDKARHADTRLLPVAAHGIAVASVNYRLVDSGCFPDQVLDVKAAVRWLRMNALDLNISTEKIAAWGASAGAQLASLAALAQDLDLTGTTGNLQIEEASRIDCVVSWFGVSDLLASSSRSALETRIALPGFEAEYLGVSSVADDPELARRASSLSHVSREAPPFLIVHGDRDRVVSPQQSVALHEALTRAGACSTLLLLGGAGHEDSAFEEPAHLAMIAGFLKTHLAAR